MRGEQLKFFSGAEDSGSKNKRKLIVLPLDTFILSGVVIVLLFILAFSLGVERGRRIVSRVNDDKELFTQELQQKKMPLLAQGKNSLIADDKINDNVSALGDTQRDKGIKIDSNDSKAIEPISNEQGYYIQIATYNKESFAEDEAKRLKSKGFPSYVAKKGNYVVLYVGNFATKKEAQASMKLLKKKYDDCVLRTH